MSEKFFRKESAAISTQIKRKTSIGIFTAAFSAVTEKVEVRNSLLNKNKSSAAIKIIPGTIHFPLI